VLKSQNVENVKCLQEMLILLLKDKCLCDVDFKGFLRMQQSKIAPSSSDSPIWA